MRVQLVCCTLLPDGTFVHPSSVPPVLLQYLPIQQLSLDPAGSRQPAIQVHPQATH